MYALGIDLGTTFTAAATWRNGHAEVASLGTRASVIPSVVLLREDETFLTGEGASRRGLSEPHRVAREFKRRLGDTTPILLGGVPYSAEALMARLLRSVVDEVSRREGGAPAAICVSYPANWGPYKTDLLLQAVRLAGLDEPVSFTTEPEAAAVFYAQQQRIEPGAIVAVYDLGGGTFDAAVLGKTPNGFEILGRPEGIERLGGIDFDAAVFSHVAKAIGGKLDELDEDDPTAIAAVARLREECIGAKEALSADTDATIPVLLPNVSTEIRLTRAELEAMVRPALYDSIEALRRALRSANVTAEALHSVLLVGGSSRMPIVAQLVGAELGRPVAVDAHPKHAVSLGAAWLASGALSTPTEPRAVAQPVGAATAPVATVATAPLAPTAAASVAQDDPPAVSAPPISRPLADPVPVSFARGAAAVPAGGVPAAGIGDRFEPDSSPPPRRMSGSGSTYGGPPAPPSALAQRVRQVNLPLVAAVAALVIVLVGGALALALTDSKSGANGSPPPGGGASASAEPTLPADEVCSAAIKSNPRWVCLTKATITDNNLVIEYIFGDNGTPFNISRGFHLHIYGASADGRTPADRIMGTHSAQRGSWYVEDAQPSVHDAGSSQYDVVKDSPKVCARIAQSAHRLVADNSGKGTFVTGNCVPLTRA